MAFSRTKGDSTECELRLRNGGNSASVRIPAAIMQAVNLHLDEPVDVREESGRIVIEPVRHNNYDLASLVDEITDENLHGEIDFGKRVGKEAR
jgi:antitoxin MazE